MITLTLTTYDVGIANWGLEKYDMPIVNANT
jgi:hypothetical protein